MVRFFSGRKRKRTRRIFPRIFDSISRSGLHERNVVNNFALGERPRTNSRISQFIVSRVFVVIYLGGRARYWSNSRIPGGSKVYHFDSTRWSSARIESIYGFQRNLARSARQTLFVKNIKYVPVSTVIFTVLNDEKFNVKLCSKIESELYYTECNFDPDWCLMSLISLIRIQWYDTTVCDPTSSTGGFEFTANRIDAD